MRPSPLPLPVPALQAGPGYAAALALLGRDALTCDLTADGAVVGRAQLVVRRFPVLGTVVWLPLGPQWQAGLSASTQAAALSRLARRLPTTGARLWISTAATAADDAGFACAGHLPLHGRATIARLDLSPGADTIRRGLQGKWRNALLRGEAAGLRLRDAPLPIDPNHWLLRQEVMQRRARGYRGWPAALTLAYAQANPGDARLFWAEQNGERVAGIVILRHGGGATYHLGWSGPAGRAQNAHQVLIWQAIRWLQARGVAQLDLGLIDRTRSPGLTRFKLGTGALPVTLGRTWLHQPWLSRCGTV